MEREEAFLHGFLNSSTVNGSRQLNQKPAEIFFPQLSDRRMLGPIARVYIDGGRTI